MSASEVTSNAASRVLDHLVSHINNSSLGANSLMHGGFSLAA